MGNPKKIKRIAKMNLEFLFPMLPAGTIKGDQLCPSTKGQGAPSTQLSHFGLQKPLPSFTGQARFGSSLPFLLALGTGQPLMGVLHPAHTFLNSSFVKIPLKYPIRCVSVSYLHSDF